MPTSKIITSVSAAVPVDREAEFLDGFRNLIAGHHPDGLLRSELLRGQSGRWLIQTLWRDMQAIVAARQSGEPPAALRLLESVGAEPAHEVLTVEEEHVA